MKCPRSAKHETIFWASTAILSLFLLWSSYTYLFSIAVIAGVKDLGFPDYFRIQLAVMKVIAVIMILAPQIPVQLKEWAYAGIVLFFITAIVAHTAHKDPLFITLINMVFLGLLVVSYYFLHKNLHG